jgi:hypothetical protein
MLLFGGEGMVIPLTHRVTVTLMRRVWGLDWKLVWAGEGVVSFADYLGLPRAAVRTKYPRLPKGPRAFELTSRPRWVAGVVSVRLPDGRITLQSSEFEVPNRGRGKRCLSISSRVTPLARRRSETLCLGQRPPEEKIHVSGESEDLFR